MPEREVKLSLDLSLLRSRLGLTEAQLPDDASDDTINEVLAQAGSGSPDAPAAMPSPDAPSPAATGQDPQPGAGSVGPGGTQGPAQASSGAGGAATPPRQVPGGIVVDAAMWEQTQEELGAVRADRERRETKEDQEFLTKAVKGGKIPPARIDHYMTLMKADRAGTREFIDKLPQSLPITELGDLGGLDDAIKASDYPQEWLAPAERRRIDTASKAYAEGRIGDVEPGSIVREA